MPFTHLESNSKSITAGTVGCHTGISVEASNDGHIELPARFPGQSGDKQASHNGTVQSMASGIQARSWSEPGSLEAKQKWLPVVWVEWKSDYWDITACSVISHRATRGGKGIRRVRIVSEINEPIEWQDMQWKEFERDQKAD